MWILLNSVLGLDGGVVDPNGGSALLSCRHDRDSMDMIRASVDAVVVGAGTIRTENPSLAVTSVRRLEERVAEGRTEQPLPVVLTSAADLLQDRRIFAASEPRPLLLLARPDPEAASRHARRADVETLDPALPAPAATVRALERRGVRRLLVEGGPSVARAFVDAGLVDEVCLTLSPRLGASPANASLGGRALTELRLAEARAVDSFLYLRYVRRTPRHVH